MALRLPRHVDLGLARLPVKVVSRAEMFDAADCHEGEAPPDGLWDCEDETIYIGKWLPAKEKRIVLFHEVCHAVNDAQYFDRYQK
jgi:Zn-dependent peptidase ImmA (M78 family)